MAAMGEAAAGPLRRRTDEYSVLLPPALRDKPAAGLPTRTMRDWLVDTLCFVLALGWAVVAAIDMLRPRPELVQQWIGTPPWLVWADLAVGAACAGALWWRRRWPVVIGVSMLVLGTFSVTLAVAGLISMLTVVIHRRFVTTILFLAGGVTSNAIFYLVRPERGTSYVESLAWGIGASSVLVLCGMFIRARRELVVSLRDRAERAESEQQARVERARALERNRIAREMHDVLAHRITLLSLHAGGLEVAQGGEVKPEVTAAARVIRSTAHEIMNDLRFVIGVLREPGDGSGEERPQPTLGDLPALVDESRRAGAKVDLTLDVSGAGEVPAGVGRTAYRIVQEGLTNARKHAPGTVVSVAVTGAPADGLTVRLRNPAAVGRAAPVIPGTGTGLIGLQERAELAGGSLRHTGDPAGGFLLEAHLPWEQATS